MTVSVRRRAKRYLWILGAGVPCLVPISWGAVAATGSGWLWWLGPVLTFVVVPVVDRLVGCSTDNPPDSAYVELDRDRFYRWATYLYLPNQYVSLVLACWLWSGGGWVSMSVWDKLGLMVTVGIVGVLQLGALQQRSQDIKTDALVRALQSGKLYGAGDHSANVGRVAGFLPSGGRL